MNNFTSLSTNECFKSLFGVAPVIGQIDLFKKAAGKTSPAAVNVLLSYIAISNNGKFHRSYFEKIAVHWAKNNIKTAEEAMQIARKTREKNRR